MQTVKHELSYIHPILYDIDRLYTETSDITYQSSMNGLIKSTYDLSFTSLFNELNGQNVGIDIPQNILSDKHYTPIELPNYDSKNIIVCFSGGKDSFAAAAHYKKMGYNVYLYHIKGLNRAYCGKSSEHFAAQDGADTLGLPLYIDTITLGGNHKWVEHPLKNMLMLNMALSWGVKSNIGIKVATGNFRTSDINDMAFEVCGGDSIQLLNAWASIVQTIIPSFKLYIPNLNYQTAYNYFKNHPEHIQHTQSCVTQNRYKEQFRNRTQKNYNVKLLPYRCGCCWKCCVEYLWMVDNNLWELNEKYYIHCIEILLYTVFKEHGYFPGLHSGWNTYMFYDISKSKMYEELKDAFVSSIGEIRITKSPVEG